MTNVYEISDYVRIDIYDLDDSTPYFQTDPSTWKFSVEEHDSLQTNDVIGQPLTQRIQVKDDDLEQNFYFSLK